MQFGNFPKLTFWRAVLVVILAAGFYSAVLRFGKGLGAATNLSDQFPCGVWIGFDVLCGVGLAAGGFTLAAIVYIFHVERFRPLLRASILTAFLGYLLVAVGLLIPLPMLLLPKVRKNRRSAFAVALLVITGFLLNRWNVTITGVEASSGVHYYPRWTEVAVTLSMVGVGFLFFSLAVQYLNVFETRA
jgi:Ni/Fe-hydrogenase subunit HybB-like protein